MARDKGDIIGKQYRYYYYYYYNNANDHYYTLVNQIVITSPIKWSLKRFFCPLFYLYKIQIGTTIIICDYQSISKYMKIDIYLILDYVVAVSRKGLEQA